MRNAGYCRQTSSSSTSPFTLSSETGYDDFSEHYELDEHFVANFADSSDNKMTAVCHLSASSTLVVDAVLKSSSGIHSNNAPTFSSPTIELGANNTMTKGARVMSWDHNTGGTHRNAVSSSHLLSPTINHTEVANRLLFTCLKLDQSGYFKGFTTYERAVTTGNYRVGLYSLDEEGKPNKCIRQTASIAHGNANADVDLPFSDAASVSGATQANPCVITTSSAHGYVTGDRVRHENIGGMTELNDRDVTITVLTSTTYSIDGEDSTAHTAYTSGGDAFRLLRLDQGEYLFATCCDAGLGFRGAAGSQMTSNGTLGRRSAFTNIQGVLKTFTYATLPDDPTSSGSFSNLNGNVPLHSMLQATG